MPNSGIDRGKIQWDAPPDPGKVQWDTPPATAPLTPKTVTPYMLSDLESRLKNTNIQQAASNIPESALNYGSSILSAISHPIHTAKTLWDLAKGTVELAIPGEQGDEKYARALEDYYRKRYGTIDNVRKTIINDPVGFAADASIALGGVSGLAKVAGAVGKSERLAQASAALNPISMAGNAGRKALSMIPDTIAQRLYLSALKMSTTLTPEQRLSRARTGLDYSILPTGKGLEKLRGMIDDTNKAIADTVKASDKTVDMSSVVSKLNDLKTFYGNTLDPKPFTDEIDALEARMKAVHGDTLSVQAAQKIKQNTYTLLRKQYGELKNLNVEAQKALARGLKDEIVKAHPELAQLNAKDSALIGLQDSLERAVSRITNRDIIGIGAPIKTGVGHAIAPGHGGLAGLATGLMDTPQIKARLAIAINKAKKIGIAKRTIGAQQILTEGGYLVNKADQAANNTSAVSPANALPNY